MHAIEWGPGAQPHASNTRTAAPAQRADSVSIQADRLMLVLIVLFSLVAVVIGYVLSDVTLPALVGGGLSAAAVALVMTAAGSSLNRFALPLLLCATVALHIQASLGMEEFHFGVFVTLALVMVYRDWRVVLACALFLAVHHVLFDRLQAWGWGLYCITEPSFGRVLLHAAYVVLQTGVEIFIVHRMAQAFSQERELQHLVQQVDQPHTMALDMGQQEVHTGAAQRLHRMFARVHDTVASVKLAAATLHQASTHIAAGSEALAARSVQAQQSVEETAAAAHELRQSVASTAQIAQHAHDLIEQAASNAHRGGAMVGELVEHMRTIEKVSAQIADIVAVVDGLAFQTNLLALNAAVEAARAGEQGRGFAVVADEVRRLALRSSDAAKGIRRQIDQSSQAVAQGAALSGDVQTVMLGFATDIADVAQQMETIAQAAVQQHEGIAQISDSIGQLEQVTTHNADLAEQSRSAAQYVQTNAHQMLEHANLFTTSGDQSAAVAPKLRTSSLAIA